MNHRNSYSILTTVLREVNIIEVRENFKGAVLNSSINLYM